MAVLESVVVFEKLTSFSSSFTRSILLSLLLSDGVRSAGACLFIWPVSWIAVVVVVVVFVMVVDGGSESGKIS